MNSTFSFPHQRHNRHPAAEIPAAAADGQLVDAVEVGQRREQVGAVPGVPLPGGNDLIAVGIIHVSMGEEATGTDFYLAAGCDVIDGDKDRCLAVPV